MAGPLQEVHLPARDPSQLAEVIGAEEGRQFLESVALPWIELLGRSSIFNINSTSTGGGVAEMLRVLLPYARGVGLDARWLVIDADPPFFTITKRIHNHLYGRPGDGGPLGEEEHRLYEEALRANAAELVALVKPGDRVILHDPQTAGLLDVFRDRDVRLLWRCHVGIDTPNEHSAVGWKFLQRYLEPPAAGAYVFSRRSFAPPWLPTSLVHVIPPSIDPFSPKNSRLTNDEARRILVAAGLLAGERAPAAFARADGSSGRIDHFADIVRNGPPVDPDTPIVAQVSRWDRLKDMEGVMRGFAELATSNRDAHLVLAGPAVGGVADDPEGAQVLDECWMAWRELPDAVRARVTLACIPMNDLEENAAIVNALQRHATVVVQKSLAEGFGLTVAEAMYKGTPVLASAIGGIVDQIVDGESGVLLDEPTDLHAFAAELGRLLEDAPRRHAIGLAGQQRAIAQFLPNRHLGQWVEVLTAVRTS